MEYSNGELILSRDEMSRAIISYAGRQVKVLGLEDKVPQDAEINIDMCFTGDGEVQGCVIKFIPEYAEFTEIEDKDVIKEEASNVVDVDFTEGNMHIKEGE